MSEISDSLTRADEQHFTRPIPKSAGAQVRFLVKQLKSTKAVASALAISQRTVERYVKNEIKQPKPALAARLEAEVRRRWQPWSASAPATRRPAPPASSSRPAPASASPRPPAPPTTAACAASPSTSPEYASRLFAAQDAGAAESQLRQIAAEGLQEIYFKDNGARATSLLVEFTDIDYVDFAF